MSDVVCFFVLWPLVPVGRSDGNTSQRVHKSLWIVVIDCVTLQELSSLSGYFGSGWVIRHKPSQITSPKLLLYHQLNVPFHGFLDPANFLQFITPSRAKFNRNWIVPRNMKVILTFRQNFLAPLRLFSYLSRQKLLQQSHWCRLFWPHTRK